MKLTYLSEMEAGDRAVFTLQFCNEYKEIVHGEKNSLYLAVSQGKLDMVKIGEIYYCCFHLLQLIYFFYCFPPLFFFLYVSTFVLCMTYDVPSVSDTVNSYSPCSSEMELIALRYPRRAKDIKNIISTLGIKKIILTEKIKNISLGTVPSGEIELVNQVA